MRNATGVNSRAGVTYLPGSPDFIPGFQWGRDIVSGCKLWTTSCHFVLFVFWSLHCLSSVLRFPACDYPVGIFKLFLGNLTHFCQNTIQLVYSDVAT